MARWCKYLLLTLMLFVASVVSAQSFYGLPNYASDQINRSMEMGVVLGAGYMNLDATAADLSLSPKVGFRGAFQMSLVWSQAYALQMEVAYAMNKVYAVMGKREMEVDSRIVEVPLMFSYRGIRSLRIGAGVVFSPIALGRYDTDRERVEFGQVRSSVGYVANVGVMLSRHLLLDARYVGGLGRVANYFEGAEFESQSWHLTLSLGYMF